MSYNDRGRDDQVVSWDPGGPPLDEEEKISVILIKRDNRMAIGHNPFIFMCDGEEMGNVWMGETRYFNVSCGKHKVKIIGAGLGHDAISNSLELELDPLELAAIRSITHRRGSLYQFRESHQTLQKVLFQLKLHDRFRNIDISLFPDHRTIENCLHDQEFIERWFGQ